MIRSPVSQSRRLILICSVELEGEPLLSQLETVTPLHVGGKPAWQGMLDGRPALLLVGGMGKTNAAHALTAALERGGANSVVGFGVGGAYAGSGLAVGDVALATCEIYGDEGVEAPGGWLSTEGIGIPLLERDGTRTFNHFPVGGELIAPASAALQRGGIRSVAGPFLTLSACSGTARRGTELVRRFSVICETMEGAAYAHVAAIYELPFLEVRGISNLVEDRDLSGWRLRDAAEAAAHAARLAASILPH